MYEALTYLLDNTFIRFCTKLDRQIIGIPMGTNCGPLIAVLFLFCYDKDYMASRFHDKQAEILDNLYFEGMVDRIYTPELQLNKANESDTEAPFSGFTFIYFK